MTRNENPNDIVLIQPPVEDFYFTFKRSIPYGLASMAAALSRKGFSVRIVDALAVNKSKPLAYPSEMAFLETFYGRADQSCFSLFHHYRHYGYSFEHLGNQVRRYRPFLVGVSALFTAYAEMARQTVCIVKKFNPQCRVVVGGHHPTQFFREVLDWDGVDFVIRGEGEAPLTLLGEALARHPAALPDISPALERDLKNIPGLAFVTRSGKVHVSEPAWTDPLASLDLPRLDLINQGFYSRGGRGSAVVVAGRGCPMGCTYCSVGASASYGPFRQRPVADVLAEIKHGRDHYNTGFVDFEDENFTLDKKWCLALLAGICKLAGTTPLELRAMNGLYPPSLDEEMVRAMKRAGFQTLNLSLGSTSAAQLKRFGRPDVRAAHDRALDLAQKYGMTAVSYLIAGAPGQDAGQSLSDLLFLASRRTLVGMSIYYPAPGSVDYGICQSKGLLPAHFSLMRSTALPVADTTTRLASVTLLRLSRVLNFIKEMADRGMTFPSPAKPPAFFPAGDVRDPGVSLALVAAFFDDARLRGVGPEGAVFEHCVDPTLCQDFIRGLSRQEIRGRAGGRFPGLHGDGAGGAGGHFHP